MGGGPGSAARPTSLPPRKSTRNSRGSGCFAVTCPGLHLGLPAPPLGGGRAACTVRGGGSVRPPLAAAPPAASGGRRGLSAVARAA